MGHIFNRGALGLLPGGGITLADTFKARLSRTSETLSKDSTSMTGLGVSATDVVVTGVAITEDTANDRIVFDHDDPTFAGVTGAEVDKYILYKFVTNDAGSTPIAACGITPITPFGGDIIAVVTAAASGGAFYLQQ